MTVDPTSDLAEDDAGENASHCGTCNDPTGYDPDHRVVTWIDAGTVQTEHFCSPACRTDFLQSVSSREE